MTPQSTARQTRRKRPPPDHSEHRPNRGSIHHHVASCFPPFQDPRDRDLSTFVAGSMNRMAQANGRCIRRRPTGGPRISWARMATRRPPGSLSRRRMRTRAGARTSGEAAVCAGCFRESTEPLAGRLGCTPGSTSRGGGSDAGLAGRRSRPGAGAAEASPVGRGPSRAADRRRRYSMTCSPPTSIKKNRNGMRTFRMSATVTSRGLRPDAPG